MGAFFLVRRQVFDEVGGFDERFFVYLEDLDFSLRAREAGWRTHYLASARAYHKGGGTSEQVKAERAWVAIDSGRALEPILRGDVARPVRRQGLLSSLAGPSCKNILKSR